MNPRNHLRREMPDQHRTVDRRNDSARRIRRHIVFRKQRKSVDPVRHHFKIIKFRQVFRDKKRGCGAVEKHHVAVFDQFDRRQGDFFLFQAVLVRAEGKAGQKIIAVVYLRAAVRARHQPFLFQLRQPPPHRRSAQIQLRRKLADFRVFSLLQKTENFFLFVFFHNSRPFSPK